MVEQQDLTSNMATVLTGAEMARAMMATCTVKGDDALSVAWPCQLIAGEGPDQAETSIK